MHRRAAAIFALAQVALILAGLPLSAEETPAAPPAPKWYDEIAVNGFLSATYSYNFNRPDSGRNQLRVFDFDDNTFKVDVVTLTLQKAVAKPGEVGFRVDADAGASIPRVTAAHGMFQGQDFDLKQAFVSTIAPLGTGLRVDVGKFLTSFSYEFIESWDTPNDNVTRSFTFGYAFPATHTGVKATYAFSDELTAMAMVVNGWDNVKDNNSSKSVCAQLAWTPTKTVSVTGNFMTGPERTGVNGDARTVFELIAQGKPSERVVVALDGVIASERGAAAGGGTASWRSVTAYLRLGLTDAFALCFRGELFDDSEGVRTGTAQRLKELTLTPELKLSSHLLVRADLRVDWSDVPVFEKKGAATSKSQPTVILNAATSF